MSSASSQSVLSRAWGALGPSWAMVSCACLTLTWRFGAFWVRDAFGGDITGTDVGPDAVLKGVLWDLSLVYGLFALARASVMAAAPRPGDDEATSSTVIRWTVLLPCVVIAVLSVVIRMADLGHCYLGQCHWTTEAFLYLDAGMAGFALSGRIIALLAMALLNIAWWILCLVRDSRRAAVQCLSKAPGWHHRLWAIAPLLVAAFPAFWTIQDGVVHQPDVYSARLVPEINIAMQWRTLQRGPVCSENQAYCMNEGDGQDIPVPSKSWQRWQKFGLVPGHSSPKSPFPLLRFGLDEPSLKELRREGVPKGLRPNLVMTLVESMSGHFVHSLSGHYQGLTPELDRLSQQMTSVSSFWNTASPTVNALVAILCSIHASTHPSDLGIGEDIDGRAPFTCISDILRKKGYRTVFVGGFVKTVTSIEFLMRTHGFDEVHGRSDLSRRFPRRALGAWGFYDDDLVEYVGEQVQRLEALREKDGRPYLLVMLTMDSHEPGMAPPSCRLPRQTTATGAPVQPSFDDAASNLQLASMHCADRAMGRLGRFLLDPQRRDRTMWMLTADHALIRTPGARKILFDQSYYGGFAPIPLYIHDPLHNLPNQVDVLSGSTDIVPTLLHLLDVVREPNSFTGHSVFGNRKRFPLLLGRMGARLVMMADKDRKAEKPLGWTRQLCREGKRYFWKGDDPLSPCELMGFFDWTDAIWKSKRVLPPTVFGGARGVDVERLDRKQQPNKAEKRHLEQQRQQARQRSQQAQERRTKRALEAIRARQPDGGATPADTR